MFSGPRAFATLFGIAISGLAGSAVAQTAWDQNARLAFDVASVRQNLSGDSGEGINRPHVNFPIGSDDAFYDTGGVFSATNLPLISYLIFAYKITNNNRQALIDSAPGWVNSEHYNIEARTDRNGVTKDQMRQMMRQLLTERFKLDVHTDTREVRVFAAVLDRPGRTGPQVREHPSKDRRFGGGGVQLSSIVSSSSALGNLGRPVVDRTGLQGLYDFVLEFLPDVPPEAQTSTEGSGHNFVAALKSQLGLKLVPDKAPIEFVLVDHIERPTPN